MSTLLSIFGTFVRTHPINLKLYKNTEDINLTKNHEKNFSSELPKLTLELFLKLWKFTRFKQGHHGLSFRKQFRDSVKNVLSDNRWYYITPIKFYNIYNYCSWSRQEKLSRVKSRKFLFEHKGHLLCIRWLNRLFVPNSQSFFRNTQKEAA